MKQAEFEQLLTAAGLNTISKYAPRFLVVLRIPRELKLENGGVITSIRHQCDVIELTPEELEQLAPEQAKEQIATFKRMLERAANTKQGRTTAERAPRTKKKVVEKVVPVSTLKYPVR